MSIVNTRAVGSMRMSMSMRTDSSFWNEQAIASRGWWRSTMWATSSSALRVSKSGVEVVAIAIRPRTRPRRG